MYKCCMLDLKIVPISRAQYFQLVIVCLQTCEEFRGIDFKAPLFCILLEEIKKKKKQTKTDFEIILIVFSLEVSWRLLMPWLELISK